MPETPSIRCRVPLEDATEHELYEAIRKEFPDDYSQRRIERAVWDIRFQGLQDNIKSLLEVMEANIQSKDGRFDPVKMNTWTQASNGCSRLQSKVNKMLGIDTTTKP